MTILWSGHKPVVAKPINELVSVSSLTGNEQFPVVQYGATKKASINDIAVPLSHFFPAIGVAITGVNSVETGGSLVSGVTIDLVNDTASPGALMLYGTDLAGTRGWQPQTAGGTVAVVDSGAGLTGGPITVSGSLSVATNGIADTMLRQSAALSVMGRSANSTGNVADIAATTSGHVLQVVGNALAFAPVTASGIGAVASVSGTANEITAIGVDVVTIGLSNTLYFGGKTVSGGTFYNMVVNNITVSGGTEQGVTYSGGTIWNAVVNSPTVSGGTWQGGTLSGPVLNNPTINNVTVSGSTFNNSTLNNPTVSGGNFSAPRLSNAVAGGNWTTSGTWALPAITLSGAVTATGQTITAGTYNNPTVSGGNFSAPRLSTAVVGGNWTTSGTWATPAMTLSGAVTATGQTITNGTFTTITLSGITTIPGGGQISAAGLIGVGAAPASGQNLDITTSSASDQFATVRNSGTAAAGLRLLNSSAGGHDYQLLSTGAGNGPGAGTWSLYDNTASAYRFGVTTSGMVTVAPQTAMPAGGQASVGLGFSTTANFGVFFGSGVPTISAAQGSLYLRSNGTGIADRAYINTGGTWTNLVTGG